MHAIGAQQSEALANVLRAVGSNVEAVLCKSLRQVRTVQPSVVGMAEATHAVLGVSRIVETRIPSEKAPALGLRRRDRQADRRGSPPRVRGVTGSPYGGADHLLNDLDRMIDVLAQKRWVCQEHETRLPQLAGDLEPGPRT